MEKVFEDEFMELQSGLIGLCMETMEIANIKVSKVYSYCSIEEYSRAFNAFFEVGGEVKNMGEMGIDRKLVGKLLRIGTADLDRIEAVCVKHGKPIPREIKMCYNADTGKFSAQYKYEPVCTAETEKNIYEVFMAWIDEVKQSTRPKERPRGFWPFGRNGKR